MPGRAVLASIHVEVDPGVLATLVGDREGFSLTAVGGLGRSVGSPVRPEVVTALGYRADPGERPHLVAIVPCLIVAPGTPTPGHLPWPGGERKSPGVPWVRRRGNKGRTRARRSSLILLPLSELEPLLCLLSEESRDGGCGRNVRSANRRGSRANVVRILGLCNDDPMAKTVIVKLTDDFDGSDADETIYFSVDGRSYEIDVNGANAARLRDALKPFIERGRAVDGTARPARSNRSHRASTTEKTLYSQLKEDEKTRFRTWSNMASARRISDARVEGWIAAGRP